MAWKICTFAGIFATLLLSVIELNVLSQLLTFSSTVRRKIIFAIKIYVLLTTTLAFTILPSSSSSQNVKIINDNNVSNLSATILDCAYTTKSKGAWNEPTLLRRLFATCHQSRNHLTPVIVLYLIKMWFISTFFFLYQTIQAHNDI